MDPLHFKKVPCRVCGEPMLTFSEDENPICYKCELPTLILISECPTIDDLKRELACNEERIKTIPNMPELEE